MTMAKNEGDNAVRQRSHKTETGEDAHNIAHIRAVSLGGQVSFMPPQFLKQRVRCFDEMAGSDFMENEGVPIKGQKSE
ncbi:MAG: hypothetical protein HEP70_13015 [Rhodobiaceae bacterium]|nr:hypothetical protein [Rhodobiaceae bacterium]